MAKDGEHFFMFCSAICVPYFQNSLFSSIPLFKMVLFVFLIFSDFIVVVVFKFQILTLYQLYNW